MITNFPMIQKKIMCIHEEQETLCRENNRASCVYCVPLYYFDSCDFTLSLQLFPNTKFIETVESIVLYDPGPQPMETRSGSGAVKCSARMEHWDRQGPSPAPGKRAQEPNLALMTPMTNSHLPSASRRPALELTPAPTDRLGAEKFHKKGFIAKLRERLQRQTTLDAILPQDNTAVPVDSLLLCLLH